ncbi:MAG: HAMP domain-containing sensor histidine kinase [Eubacteriales bacterium]|nr:HAMP domain-containing sensor histidine kinase [Eubacteriales bacterium]
MRLFVNEGFRAVFRHSLYCVLAYAAASVAVLLTAPAYAAFLLFAGGLLLAGVVLALFVRYFDQQEQQMEAASKTIAAYLSGDRNARIPCEEEGKLYRLFHEINSLASILNAHAENEAKAKEFLQQTLSNISHQLKTPLAALSIYNGILQSEGGDPVTRTEFTNRSEAELDRIEALVQSLLKMAKLDAGTIVLQKVDNDLSELLGEIAKSFTWRQKQEGKQLLLSGPENVTLNGDRLWLTEAIGNLMKNALDHTNEGDWVEVTWNSYAGAVQIVVQDNGNGVHPEDLPYIFKRFYRSRFSTDTQGVGLGLPIAKAVIEAHGGTIEVESSLGNGARFTLYFPIPTKM